MPERQRQRKSCHMSSVVLLPGRECGDWNRRGTTPFEPQTPYQFHSIPSIVGRRATPARPLFEIEVIVVVVARCRALLAASVRMAVSFRCSVLPVAGAVPRPQRVAHASPAVTAALQMRQLPSAPAHVQLGTSVQRAPLPRRRSCVPQAATAPTALRQTTRWRAPPGTRVPLAPRSCRPLPHAPLARTAWRSRRSAARVQLGATAARQPWCCRCARTSAHLATTATAVRRRRCRVATPVCTVPRGRPVPRLSARGTTPLALRLLRGTSKTSAPPATTVCRAVQGLCRVPLARTAL